MAHLDTTINNFNECTLTVRIARSLRLRWWLGLRIICFGAWVTGMHCEVDYRDE